jgi:hypothetical protein
MQIRLTPHHIILSSPPVLASTAEKKGITLRWQELSFALARNFQLNFVCKYQIQIRKAHVRSYGQNKVQDTVSTTHRSVPLQETDPLQSKQFILPIRLKLPNRSNERSIHNIAAAAATGIGRYVP